MTAAKRSILFISTQLPFPPKSGGTVKSFHYVKDLSQRYHLSVACLLKDDDADYVEEFQKQVKLERCLVEPHQTSRNALTLLKSMLGFPCLNVYRNYSVPFKQKVETVISEYDIVLIDHYEVFQYVSKDFKGKVVLHTHNAEFMLWQRMSELESNPIKKALLKNEARRVKKYEQAIFDQSDLVYTTESDQELYKKHGFQLSNFSTTYHLGNDQLLAKEDLKFEETELALTFMGTLSWEPNVDGLLWFLNEVWPTLKTKFPQLIFYILGKEPDERIKKRCANEAQIVFTGFVEDLDDYLKKTRVYLAPLRFGSGMKVKVLEGLYRGVPTVSSSVGAEGLQVKDGQHIMIADTAEGFISKCILLLEEADTWTQLRNQSRKVAAEKYRWAPLFERMDEALKKLI
ncbi:MAG: glycosyltransferase [Vicingaceae bacterium]